jgi:putative hemolysin
MTTAMEIVALLFLIVLNGAFAMSELALVSSRKARLQQWADEGRRGAAAALALSDNPSNFLSTIQVGITVIGITSGAFGEATIAQPLAGWLSKWPLAADHAQLLATAIVVTAITAASLIVGELVPKRLALLNPERIASATARPMSLLTIAAYPVVRLLSLATGAALHLIGVRPSAEPPVTEEEIRILMNHGTRAGVFEAHERKLVSRVFRLDELRVEGIMTPRADIVFMDVDESNAANLSRAVASNHSRLPACRGSLDNVLGLVFMKHLLSDAVAGKGLNIEAHLVAPLYVPETITVMSLVALFKKHRETAALVVNEFGDVQGLVTLHDVMEALAGDIAVVGEEAERDFVRRENGSWLMDASMTLQRLRDVLDLRGSLPGEEEDAYHTLAGFVITQLGRIPRAGDKFRWGDFRFEVVDMDRNRVDKVIVAREGRHATIAAAEGNQERSSCQ